MNGIVFLWLAVIALIVIGLRRKGSDTGCAPIESDMMRLLTRELNRLQERNALLRMSRLDRIIDGLNKVGGYKA